VTRSPAKYRLVSPLLATIARHKGPLNYYADRFLLVVAAATTIQSLVIGWRDQFPDFRIFYVSAWLMRRGGDPYLGLASQDLGPNTNTPSVIVLTELLTWLPYATAAMVWLGLGLLTLWATVRALAPDVVPTSRRILLLIVLATQACALTIRQGQIVFFVMALFTYAWLADRDGRSGRSGLALGVLMALKPFYGLFAIYMLWRRDWRACAGIVGGGLLCAAVMLFDFRPEIVRSWVVSLSQINWQAHLTNVSVRGLAARWFAAPPQQPYALTTTPIVVSRELEVAAWIGAVALIAFLTARGVTRRQDRTQAWAVISLAALLLSPLAEIHYAIVGIGPIGLAFSRSRRWRAAWLTGIGLSLPYALVDRFHGGVIGTVTFGSVYGLSMMALWWEMLRPLPGEAVSSPPGANPRR
jgi:Glycosyltransferase family 87